MPPVMAFHLGSLGFLTPFKFESYKTEVAKVFEGTITLSCKMGSGDPSKWRLDVGSQATQPSPSAVA